MEQDLTLLGNAAAIPIIIGLTQLLKKNFNFKRKSEVLSLFVSLGVCLGWEIYYTPEAELISAWTSGIIPTVKHVIHLVIVSGATWLSASKSYDFFLGEKKKKEAAQEQQNQKEDLQQHVSELQEQADDRAADDEERNNNAGTDETLDQKVRHILED